jgi:manganese/zinc/iron transport system permease protein
VLYNHAELSPHSLAQRRRSTPSRAQAELEELAAKGWVLQRGSRWELTEGGHAEAHRLEQAMRVLPKARQPHRGGAA